MNNFRDMTSRLARGHNFETGAFVLATTDPDNKRITVDCKGTNGDLLNIVRQLVGDIMGKVDKYTQKDMCEVLMDIVSENQARRFQEREIAYE